TSEGFPLHRSHIDILDLRSATERFEQTSAAAQQRRLSTRIRAYDRGDFARRNLCGHVLEDPPFTVCGAEAIKMNRWSSRPAVERDAFCRRAGRWNDIERIAPGMAPHCAVDVVELVEQLAGDDFVGCARRGNTTID